MADRSIVNAVQSSFGPLGHLGQHNPTPLAPPSAPEAWAIVVSAAQRYARRCHPVHVPTPPADRPVGAHLSRHAANAPRCLAIARSTGARCRRPCVVGSDHCFGHGGCDRAPWSRAAARRYLAGQWMPEQAAKSPHPVTRSRLSARVRALLAAHPGAAPALHTAFGPDALDTTAGRASQALERIGALAWFIETGDDRPWRALIAEHQRKAIWRLALS